MSLSKEATLKKTDKVAKLTGAVEVLGAQARKVHVSDVQAGIMNGARLGRLVSVEESGDVIVDYEGNTFGPLPARSIVRITSGTEKKDPLLIFERNNPRFPIIIGFVEEHPAVSPPSKEVTLDKKKIRDIIVDGQRIVFDAKKEIVLRSGKGSVTIRTDGKIVIKGTDLISRSRGMNRIKGAAVRIN